ncbi:ornithine cyclodeaminase family protein [Cognatishimia sp. 1_MG-2023]|uniref:ornithine cyclodeaminase family protein n=1 Tax=Cognatishimia sp. 1_MG-2023 TaxID=3062642 RepID=UPI0026E3B599|nr:ornithine cyclodeaminase family protein [Cognatishimia sp. 1_MG-2023]MDO6728211.1 ornithine cyclodeaminase family protein [Cognatishimia sp. 1_MG-2023]
MTQFLDGTEINQQLDWPSLIAQLKDWFTASKVQAPERQICTIEQPDGSTASLLIMPAWIPGQAIGVKVVTFFPQNASQGLSTINAGYLSFDGQTGQLRAVMEGDALTEQRTAAASALAASYLARKNAKRLLVVGTGQLARSVATAHAAVRSYDSIHIWGRTSSKAQTVAEDLQALGLPAAATTDLQTACRGADVISTVTASTRPIIHGEWLKPGTHLDLIGAFQPNMRESDTKAITQANLFVDNPVGALQAGDLATPLTEGAIQESHISATLTDLCQGSSKGRKSNTEYTVFKSVGMALEDLAAASLIRVP